MIITVASTAFLLHALWAAGHNVVALDADPQGSLRRWADYGPGRCGSSRGTPRGPNIWPRTAGGR